MYSFSIVNSEQKNRWREQGRQEIREGQEKRKVVGKKNQGAKQVQSDGKGRMDAGPKERQM